MNTPSVLFVIAPKDFRDEELLIPRATLTAAGAAITLASTQAGQATGMLGATVDVTTVLDDVKDQLFDAIVVVGGMGSPEYLWNNTTLQQLIQHHQQQGKILAAICLSGVVLANAGVLNGKQATVWPADQAIEAYKTHGVNYTETPVVTDGLIITANGPEAAFDFANALLLQLGLAHAPA